MGKRIPGVFSAVVILSILFCVPAHADGGLFGKDGRDISEPEQKAVIFFHGGSEELVLSVRYEGASEDFAWLVPTPGQPEIGESSISLFEVMSRVTPADEAYGTFNGRGWVNGGMGKGVDVLDELTVGAFDLTVVRSDDAGALRAWLEERGFAYDAEAEAVLADYVERGWCFTAMRINPRAADPMQGGLEYELSQGLIDPVRFTFDTPEPVYPLRISSLNPGDTEVLLYVLGPEAYGHESLRLEYAERWQPVQAGALAEFSQLAGAMEEDGGCFLTKLRRTFSPEDMEDLYLTPLDASQLAQWPGVAALAEGDDSVSWWGLLLIALSLAVLAAAAYVFSGERRRGWAKKTAVVFLAAALAGSAVLLPLGLLVLPARGGEAARGEAGTGVDWPWEDGILMEHNGWSKLVHPDGRVEITGLEQSLIWAMTPPQAGPEEYSPHILTSRKEVDEGSGLEWSLGFYRTDDWQTVYLLVKGEDGEVREVEIGMKEVHDVRLSPEGDILWVAMNPGVPVDKTEVQEYAFPSMELLRSIVHDECLRVGEIVLSTGDEPLLAGRFERGEEYADAEVVFGFLPMLEEGAGFWGRPFEVSYAEMQSGEDMKLMRVINSYTCFARDASPFLLLGGYDYETGVSTALVLDSSDGSVYEAGEGYPVGWQ
jgi:hypothetical protein